MSLATQTSADKREHQSQSFISLVAGISDQASPSVAPQRRPLTSVRPLVPAEISDRSEPSESERSGRTGGPRDESRAGPRARTPDMPPSKPALDEYIDYSCSTSLERLSRDVETALRGWHVASGSDRHVSLTQRTIRPAGGGRGRVSGGAGGPTAASSRLIRSADVCLAAFPLPGGGGDSEGRGGASVGAGATTERVDVSLRLCLWDGPPSSRADEETDGGPSSIRDGGGGGGGSSALPPPPL